MEKKQYVKRGDIDKLLTSDRTAAAILSKLVNTDTTKTDHKPMFSSLKATKYKDSNYKATQDFLKVFPDLELACEIMIALTLTPKDINKVDLSFALKNTNLPHQMVNSILSLVRQQATRTYKIQDKLYKTLRAAYYGYGAAATAVLSESHIDRIINGPVTSPEELTTEALRTVINDKTGGGVSLGILGSDSSTDSMYTIEQLYATGTIGSTPASLYGYTKKEDSILMGLDITDNFHLLQVPDVLAKRSKLTIENIMHSRVLTGLSKKIEYEEEDTVILDKDDPTLRKTIGPATEIDLDPRSLLVVHAPGNPEDHVGYLVPLDASGNQVGVDDQSKEDAQAAITKTLGKNTIGSGILSKASKNLKEMNDKTEQRTAAIDWYGDYIINSVQNRLFNGAYSRRLDIAGVKRVFTILLGRALKEKNTRLLFLPKEMVSYFAIEYDASGKGVNVLEKLNILNSMRSTLLYSMLASEVYNNIPQTEVKISISPEDKDPDKTSNMAIDELIKVRQFALPMGLHNPTDQVNWLHRSGLRVSYDEHPGLPGVRFEFSDAKIDRSTISRDDALWTDMRKQALMGIGPPPSMVDDSFDTDYASVAENSRLVLAKRLYTLRNLTDQYATEHVSLLMSLDGNVIKGIVEILSSENISKYLEPTEREIYIKNKEAYQHQLSMELIDQIEVTLPNPDTTTVENMVTEFEAQSDAIDLALEATISEDMLTTELGGDAGDYVGIVVPAVKGLLLRNWMAENNFLPEVTDLFSKDSGDKFKVDLGDTLGDHVSTLLEATSDYMKSVKGSRKKANKVIEKAINDDDEPIVEEPIDEPIPPDEGGEPIDGPTGEEDDFDI